MPYEMRKLTSLLAISASLMSACANHPKTAPPPKTAIKTIAVLPASNPAEYTLLYLSALAFVMPITQTMSYFDSSRKNVLFNARLKPQESSLAADFTRCIVAELQRHGYQIEVLDNVKRPEKTPDDIDLDTLMTNADAILQVKFDEVGVFSPRSSPQYLPRVNAHGRLYVKGREDDLYDEDVVYGVDARPGKRGEIVGDPAFSYPDFDNLLASQASVQMAFSTGANKICQVMASDVNDAIK